MRICFIANSPTLPTLEICLIKPLSPFIESGEIITDCLSEDEIRKTFNGGQADDWEKSAWVQDRLSEFRPDLIIFCRYSGPYAPVITTWARSNRVATVFHIDDDLLNVPIELGEAKFKYHNAPERLGTVRHLLSKTDLVYCSTQPLRETMASYEFPTPIINGAINASGSAFSPPKLREIRTIGYMGGADKKADLEMVAPALAAYLQEFPEVTFEIFGNVPLPAALRRVANQILLLSPVMGHKRFAKAFAKRKWDIGICPLVQTDFNSRKSDLKWIEYTDIGAAVIASAGTVYDECCSDGCGIVAETTSEWLLGLQSLTRNPQARFEQVSLAHDRLKERYSRERHSSQLLSVISSAFERASVQPKGWRTLAPYIRKHPTSRFGQSQGMSMPLGW